MRKLYNIQLEIYPADFRIHVGSVEELNKYREGRGMKPLTSKWNACLLAYYIDNIQGEFFIPFNTKNEVLVHEATHAALYVFEEIGQKIEPCVDNEYLPYLVEWFYVKLEQAVEKYKKANGKNVQATGKKGTGSSGKSA